MCIIAVKMKGGALPKEEHLRNCENRNKDGIGIAVLKEGKSEIAIKKDFPDIDVFVKWFYENVKPEDACIIHYRYATHGLKDIGNRHPFPITKNKELLRQPESICKMVMAHNGIISQYGAHATFSDTQKFVLDILSDDAIKNNIENPAVQKLISNFLGSDRLVIMMSDGTMWLWGDWTTEGNIKYSNDGYAIKTITWGMQTFRPSKWKNESYGYVDNCEACGDKTFVQANAGTFNYGICKKCRKKLKKGTLTTIGGLPISELAEMQKEMDAEDAKWEDVTPKTDVQCESCYDWIKKEEACTYLGSVICASCLNDATSYNGNFQGVKIKDND